ncbi:MAG: hypothetical protein MI673_08735, partial [Thiotrichales bacterium]|nr:hypothetical protein [Thiotrichales bacterium]
MTSSLKSRFDRLPRRVLLLGSEKLAIYHWLKGRITNSYIFDTDEAGQHQFERYLQEVPDQPAYIIADFAEEEFRQETIPHVFGGDRKAVIQRKQNRLFRDATYCYSHIQGRDTEGRRACARCRARTGRLLRRRDIGGLVRLGERGARPR